MGNIMSIARITMMEHNSEEAAIKAEKFYLSVQKKYFPNAELIANIRTGPKSVLSLAIYPSFEDAEKNLLGREKFQKAVKAQVIDSFYYEGDLTYFYLNPNAEIKSHYNETDRARFAAGKKV